MCADARMSHGDAAELFDRLTNLYRGQVWLPEDRAWGYPLLSALTLSTYHARQASHWFIVDLEGSTGSGKGEILKVFTRAGHRVPPIAIVPTVAQLYHYTHVNKGEDPKAVIFDELHLHASNRDVLAILNGGLSRETVVPRRINGKPRKFRPWGIKWLVHEGTLPRSFHSLRRRCIRLQTAQNEDFTPTLVTDEELDEAVEALRPDLERWRETDLKPLVARWLHNAGTVNGEPFTLSGVERPIWPLVLATAECCGRLDALIPSVSANRTGRDVNTTGWWRRRALPMLKEFDPAGMTAADLLDEMRAQFGVDIPPLSAKSLGRLLRFAVADKKLRWTSRVSVGRRRYWLRRTRAARRSPTGYLRTRARSMRADASRDLVRAPNPPSVQMPV